MEFAWGHSPLVPEESLGRKYPSCRGQDGFWAGMKSPDTGSLLTYPLPEAGWNWSGDKVPECRITKTHHNKIRGVATPTKRKIDKYIKQ